MNRINSLYLRLASAVDQTNNLEEEPAKDGMNGSLIILEHIESNE
jgi:hypothetical protein